MDSKSSNTMRNSTEIFRTLGIAVGAAAGFTIGALPGAIIGASLASLFRGWKTASTYKLQTELDNVTKTLDRFLEVHKEKIKEVGGAEKFLKQMDFSQQSDEQQQIFRKIFIEKYETMLSKDQVSQPQT